MSRADVPPMCPDWLADDAKRHGTALQTASEQALTCTAAALAACFTTYSAWEPVAGPPRGKASHP